MTKNISKERLQEIAAQVNPLAKLIDKNNINLRKDKRKKLRNVRLPLSGSLITKKYKGRILKIKVLDKGFEYDGRSFRTISSVAVHITGQHISGFRFFKL